VDFVPWNKYSIVKIWLAFFSPQISANIFFSFF
jgi:hypothetical protein